MKVTNYGNNSLNATLLNMTCLSAHRPKFMRVFSDSKEQRRKHGCTKSIHSRNRKAFERKGTQMCLRIVRLWVSETT